MKSVAIIYAIGALWVSFPVFAPAAESNSAPATIVPARSMLTMGGIATTPERKASPRFNGTSLPVPPKQHARWLPPETELPTNYVSATRVLFEQGLPNPRGCDYREIEVGTGDVWRGDGGVVQTHGWVLPGDSKPQFAVCWNGMIYPVVGVGTNADLDADVKTLETKGFVGWQTALSEATAVSQGSLLGIKGCFLLRLGKVDLATRLWMAQTHRGIAERNEMLRRFSQTNAVASTNEIKLPDTDPYLGWATDWAWAMFDRTVCAHERGDEKLALVTARQLATAQSQIETECAKRGFKHQPYYDSNRRGQQQPYLNFLGQFPDLLTDLERREKEGPRVSVMSRGLTNITDQPERVASLIHDLDLVQAHQWGQPGWVNLSEDPIVSALIQEGDAAVEPLLNCLEHDKRLTRSVGFGRDFHRDRTVIGVASAASVALRSILQAGFAGPAEIRAYWNKYKGMNLDERWYAILSDDTASGRWLEAAAHITQPENQTTFPGGFSTTKPAPTNAPVRLRGEILRNKSNPSIAEIMARRATEVPENNPNAYDLSAACQMGLHLASWDERAAEPVIKTLTKRCHTVMAYSGQQFGTFLVKFALFRARTGDEQAFDDYAEWLKTTTPEQLGRSILESLEPLQKFPTNAVLQAAAEKLFAETNSAWSKLPWKGMVFDNPVESDLANVPAFRVLVARELGNTNLCGSFDWRSANQLGFSLTNLMNMSGSRTVSFPEGEQPAVGTKAELRWCDWMAVSLFRGKQIPFFNPFAPLGKRDEEIQTAKELLLRR